MEPSVSADETKERKKIQFAVPASAPTNLDPRQVEMIRRRRPTPATLFRVADHASPDDDPASHQVKWVVGENGVLKPKRINQNVYQPPSLKAVQKMAEAHMQNLGVYPALEDPCEGDEDEQDWLNQDDHQDTAASEQPERPHNKQIQAAAEEDEEDEEEGKSISKNNMKGTTEEHSTATD